MLWKNIQSIIRIFSYPIKNIGKWTRNKLFGEDFKNFFFLYIKTNVNVYTFLIYNNNSMKEYMIKRRLSEFWLSKWNKILRIFSIKNKFVGKKIIHTFFYKNNDLTKEYIFTYIYLYICLKFFPLDVQFPNFYYD